MFQVSHPYSLRTKVLSCSLQHIKRLKKIQRAEIKIIITKFNGNDRDTTEKRIKL
jgi:hypothetical protein